MSIVNPLGSDSNVISSVLGADSVPPPKELGSRASITWSLFEPLYRKFNLDMRAKQGKPRDVAKGINLLLGLGLSKQEITFLEGALSSLPKELLSAREAGEQDEYFLNDINLLQLIDQIEKSVIAGANPKTIEFAKKFTTGIRSKIEKVYVTQQLQILLNDPQNAQKLSGMSDQEKNTLALEFINSSSMSPAAQSTATYASEAGADTGQAEIYAGTGFRPVSQIPSGTGDLPTMDEYLRLNAESSILGLASLEQQGQVYSDGFDMTGILDPKGTITVRDADGKARSWTAREAVNLIYDLYEKGETKKVTELQNMMVRAGYFQDTRPVLGLVDETTVDAWNLFLTDAARNNRTPKDQFLFNVQQRWKLRSSATYQSQQDPAQVDAFVQSAAQSVLGRPLTRDEVVSVKSAILDWEKQALTSGLLPTDPTTVNFDARVVDLIQKQNQDELIFKVWAEGKDAFETIFGS